MKQETENLNSDGSETNPEIQKFAVPNVLLDITLIIFLVPSAIYLYAYFYKLGKFGFYMISPDLAEVGYHDMIRLCSIPLIFLFIFLLPFYSLFIPTSVLEKLTENKSPKKKLAKKDWFTKSVNIFFTVLMGLASLLMLYAVGDYWSLLKENYQIFLLFLFTVFLFWLQSLWDVKGKNIRQKLLKSGGVIFSILLFLLATTSIAQELGEFHAAKNPNYEKICSPEKNWIRIDKTGDKIIAKELDSNLKLIGGKTVLVGSTCSDFLVLENIKVGGLY